MSRSFKRAGSLLALVGGFALPWLVGTAEAQNADAYLQDLYKKAQAAGQKEIMVYASSSEDNIPVYQAFQKKFPGITVKYTSIFGPPLQSRLQAEFASTGPQADLVASGEPDMINLQKQGWLQPFFPETAKGIPEQLIGDQQLWINYASIPLGGVVNTSAVSPADLPKSWKDFADPKWRGKTSMSNPAQINGLSQALAAGLKAGIIDEKWLEAMAANKPLLTPGAVAALQMVATGQANLSPILAYAQYLNAKKQGAPIGFVWPSEGITALPAPFALLKNAKNADAARLLVAYFETPEAQKILSEEVGQPGVMPGAPPLKDLPPGTNWKVYILDWKYLQNNDPGHLETFKKIFGG